MSLNSAIYTGLVVHQRTRPRAHRLSYRVFSLLIDLDELDALRSGLRRLGINRPALLSFHEKDHGDGGSLRDWVGAQVRKAGIAADGPIRMLTYPRMFGYVFNPLTVYFCHGADGRLVAILYEVANTFGERHAYVLPADGATDTVRHECAKDFYVSPFMPMECRYNFAIRPPGDAVQVLINEDDAEGLLLTASFTGRRSELTDGALLKAVLSHPLMTLKVTAGIYLEAVKLVFKGMPVFAHPPGGRPGGTGGTSSGSRIAHHAPRDQKQQPIGQ